MGPIFSCLKSSWANQRSAMESTPPDTAITCDPMSSFGEVTLPKKRKNYKKNKALYEVELSLFIAPKQYNPAILLLTAGLQLNSMTLLFSYGDVAQLVRAQHS